VQLLVTLLGAVALLIWGLRMVRTGMTRAYGADLRRALGAGTRNRFVAALTGAGVTAAMQSSTATVLMIASFAADGLVPVSAALAVMLGADVGTALVARVLTFDLGWLSPGLIFAGVVAFNVGRRTRARDLGRAAIGLGLVLLSIQLLVATSAPLRDAPGMQELLRALGGEPALALLIAAALTWLAHSGLAVVLMLSSLAGSGMLAVDLALTMVIGANIGAALPALTGTLGQSALARRVALGNGLFRVVGGLLAFALLPWLVGPLVALDDTPAHLVVNLHIGFNLALLAVFIGLTGPVGVLCARLAPDRPDAPEPSQPQYLDPAAMNTPSVALANAARETLRMGDVIETMLRETAEVFRRNDRKQIARISEMDDWIDGLYLAIKLYCTEISREQLNDDDSRRCADVLGFATNLEHVGDIIDKNLMELAAKKVRRQLQFSDDGADEIDAMLERVHANLKLALSVFVSTDVRVARQLIAAKEELRDLEREMGERHLSRMRSAVPETIETSGLHLDVLRDLKRIDSHLASVAYPILETAGELRASRLTGRARRTIRGQAEKTDAAAPSAD